MTLPSVIFLPPHFATYLGIPLSIVSAMFIGVRILDIIVDPGIGNFQDRTQRAARRRFWLLVGCPFIMAIWCCYIGLAPNGPYWAAAAALVAMFFMYALMAVAHMAWSGELIPTYHGRTHVLGATQVATQLGQILMLFVAGYVALTRGSNVLARQCNGVDDHHPDADLGAGRRCCSCAKRRARRNRTSPFGKL